ncbi:MAG: ABC transporter ATP-binding protein [Rhodospirillales bacterium]|nr:MAG: ABC transporter ATP-binding protein [Rhodospirillales bacterium]
MVEVKGLSKRFGAITAVDGLTFHVGRGEVLGFLGPNGAGKTTTMRMITGYLPPDAGTAVVAGYDVLKSPLDVKARIGYLPEGAPLYGDMTPKSFLEFCANVRGLHPAGKARRLGMVSDLLHLRSVWLQPIDTLSKGFKRRVGLAQAILMNPQVLILDEPTDGLDPNQKHDVRTLLKEMAGDKAIIISTHILEEVEAVCTRAIVIAGGRIVADDTPAALLRRSRLHNAVAVTVPAEVAADGEAVLRAVAGVAAVETEVGDDGDETVRLLALPEAGQDIAAAVRAALTKAGIPVREFSVRHGRLDDVFRSLTIPHAVERAA